MHVLLCFSCFFFFNDTATTEIYTLSLHDALPIYARAPVAAPARRRSGPARHDQIPGRSRRRAQDRKSTRLNSSHSQISYAVFCLKKKKKRRQMPYTLYCLLSSPCIMIHSASNAKP